LITDAHLHLGYSKEILRGFDKTSLITFLKEKHICSCFVFPIHDTKEHIKDTHNDLKELSRLTNEVVKPLYWMSSEPTTLEDNISAINGGFYGLKYHAAYESTPISHPLFENVLEELDKKHGILLVHCGMYNNGDISSNTSYLHAIIVAAKHKNIKIILGHMGGSTVPIIKNVCLHVRKVDNIWLETSGITSPVAIDYAVNHIGADRILFGSDSLWCSFNAAVANVEDSNLSREDKERIFYNNMIELLK
jgi:predicted TIM-barrel fold metal-dependent hydrolase